MSGPGPSQDPRLSTASIISPHAALEALAEQSGLGLGLDPRDSIFAIVQPQPHTNAAADSLPAARGSDPRVTKPDRPISRMTVSSGTSTSPSRRASGLPTSTSSLYSIAPSPSRSTPRGSAYGPTQALPTPPAEPQRVFVRAKFDFAATDESALSFSAGEVIEVYTKLDSGWWDGLLGHTRGWFPSNFVEHYDVREMEMDMGAELAHGHGHGHGHDFAAREEQARQGGRAEDAGLDLGRDRLQDAARGSGTSDDFDWADAVTKGGGGWDAGDGAGAGAGGLDELARDIMQGAGIDDDAGADDFGAAAAGLRKRQAQQDESMRAMMAQGADADLADEMGPDEFGVGPRRRQREETERTVTLRRGPLGGQDDFTVGAGGHGPRASTSESVAEKDGEGGEKMEESAWVPKLTDDGQVS